jgi:hypothetical protein
MSRPIASSNSAVASCGSHSFPAPNGPLNDIATVTSARFERLHAAPLIAAYQ